MRKKISFDGRGFNFHRNWKSGSETDARSKLDEKKQHLPYKDICPETGQILGEYIWDRKQKKYILNEI